MPATAPAASTAPVTMLSASLAVKAALPALPWAICRLAGQVSTIGCATGSGSVPPPEHAFRAVLERRGRVAAAAVKSARLLSVSVQPAAARWTVVEIEGAGAVAVSLRLELP